MPQGGAALVIHGIGCSAAGGGLKFGSEAGRLTGTLSVQPNGVDEGKAWWVE
jgi:hypothetical protein